MSRALKRNIARNIKNKNEEKFPALKKMSVSAFMKKVNTEIPEDELPIDKVNKFALLMKVLQYAMLIKAKDIKDEKLLNLLNKFIETFGDLRKTSRYLLYKDTLLLADNRIDCILKSINEDFDTLAFSELDIPNTINSLIKETIAPFVLTTMQVFIHFYIEEDEVYKDNKNKSIVFDAEALGDDIEDYINCLDKNVITKFNNLTQRLLNLKHQYTTMSIKNISAEIEEEVGTLLAMYVHKYKETEVISKASNHFYKLLETKVTFSAIYDIVITRDDLKNLFRACYYYAINNVNNFLEVPEDLKDLVDALIVNNMAKVIKLRVGNKFTENNEHLKTLLLTAKLEVPTSGYILDSAIEVIVNKDEKISIEEFKIKSWNAIKALLLFLDSNKCNKLYRATYAVDIQSAQDTFKVILEDEYENHKDWFHKLFKKYDIFKMNKNYIAI